MTITIAIPVLNQLSDAAGILKLLTDTMTPTSELLILDNGSTDNYEEFCYKYLKPKKLNYIRNEHNVGVVKSMQQIYENTTTDLLMVIHNDVYMYRHGWDIDLADYFISMKDLGIAGLFGISGVGKVGERIQDTQYVGQGAGFSSMLEAEKHGQRLYKEFLPVATLDGCGMMFRTEMLNKSGGFDQRYLYHHYYDRDICLESLRLGYDNIVVNTPFHHVSGLTANRGDYQEWVSERTAQLRDDSSETGDQYVHKKNAEIFFDKWKGVLPLYVENDFSFRGPGVKYQWGEYQKDAIRGFTPLPFKGN